MLIAGQHLLIRCQLGQKSEPSEAVGGDSVTVNDHCAVEELAEVIPVEVPAILELLHQARRIESIVRLPELQHHKAADEGLIKRPCGKHAEIVDVARFVSLIAGADFFGEDFGERKADDFGRRERQ